ncbi:methyltransferase [uncultured Mucilaginibacter sp.]|uniref:tRNA1(Val) (adenine(37)-N6)-methyltransferase n=1 Tax=uncultured Mucilaginibacter sp. TaxID=797541 RepID=UPI002618FA29|nr:methyltransferase [uncultured Mucilaginibacter sp.]
MKVNTDGVLLGATASAENPKTILDIGAGTGVIALMLAQRFKEAKIDAVEIDQTSARTAGQNFKNSPFANRITLHVTSIENFWLQKQHQQYDLIVSNPPFYLDTLTSPKENKTLAKHAVPDFFENLVKNIPGFLTASGFFWLILPVKTASLVKDLATGLLFLQEEIAISSFPNQPQHRYVLSFGSKKTNPIYSALSIYESEKVYSQSYQTLLKDFLTIF